MIQGNTTFGGGEPTWANACVGNNGLPGYWDYAKGFSKAAVTLIEAVIQDGGLEYRVDEMVYPICFNMRHSVELRLKGAIEELIEIEKVRGRALEFDFKRSHDIRKIWEFFVINALTADDRYQAIVGRLESKISDISQVDPTGQTFRYPLDAESERHLVDVSIINLVLLRNSFLELESSLDDLHYLNTHLRREYLFETFTRSLSRKNIFEIASLLPPRSTWSDSAFDTARAGIKERFGISGAELSKSIKIIESHFELAPMIEVSVPLLGVVEVDIADFFCYWLLRHERWQDDDLRIEVGPSLTHSAELFGVDEVEADVWSAVEKDLTPEKLAGISALFYFAREFEFSERYRLIYESERRAALEAFKDSVEKVRAKYFHIFMKTNAVHNVLESLYFLGKSEVAERLISLYGLEKHLPWLNDARSGALFRKPDYWGYTS